MRITTILLLTCLAYPYAWAKEQDIFLIASEPHIAILESFPTLLYRVEGDVLVKVRTVTTQRQDTKFVDVFPGRGYALIGSDRGNGRGSILLDIIDMNAVSAQKSYDIDLSDGYSLVSSHMQYGHEAQVYFLEGYKYKNGGNYTGLNLATGQRSNQFDRIDEANAYRIGTGSSFVDRASRFVGIIDSSELLIFGGESPRRRALGWRLPERFDWELGSIFTDVLVNNDDVRLISVYRNSDWKGEVRGLGLHVFDKAAGEWFQLDAPMGMGSFRAFGHWLAREEIQPYRPGDLNLERFQWHQFAPFLSVAERFESRRYAPSGRLYFYNARTRVSIVHDTGEPDTEILFVDDDDVAWYRVSDELHRAPILEGGLGSPEVVVAAPELWAVHWLFFGKG